MKPSPQPHRTILDIVMDKIAHWSTRGGTQAEIRISELHDVLHACNDMPARDLIPVIKRLKEIVASARPDRKKPLESLIAKLEQGLR